MATKKTTTKKAKLVNITIDDAPVEDIVPIVELVLTPELTAPIVKAGMYVTNKALLAEVKRSHEKGDMTRELAEMIMLITERYARRGSYASYTYNEDMQSFAVMNLVKSWKSFKPEMSQNPFAYFTSCIHNSFLQYLNQERKHRNIRDALLIENGLDPSYTFTGAYQYPGDAPTTSTSADNEKSNETNEATE